MDIRKINIFEMQPTAQVCAKSVQNFTAARVFRSDELNDDLNLMNFQVNLGQCFCARAP